MTSSLTDEASTEPRAPMTSTPPLTAPTLMLPRPPRTATGPVTDSALMSPSTPVTRICVLTPESRRLIQRGTVSR